MSKRAGEELFEELHALLTNELVARIKTGEASTADLRAAIDWLSKNAITGVPVADSPLKGLMDSIPELDFEDVVRSYGS